MQTALAVLNVVQTSVSMYQVHVLNSATATRQAAAAPVNSIRMLPNDALCADEHMHICVLNVKQKLCALLISSHTTSILAAAILLKLFHCVCENCDINTMFCLCVVWLMVMML
jgi:hypothetical protein